MADDDAIALIRSWAGAHPASVELLPCDPSAGRRCLAALDVTTRSPLGAVAFHTGGILVDHGWLRVLGAGCERLLRALDTWNRDEHGRFRFAHGVLVADDVLGGFFAWFREPQTIHYVAPDTYEWEDLELGYGDWLAAMLTERISEFYADYRWAGWEDEVRALDLARGFHVYPPLPFEGLPIGDRSRKAVPVEELWHFALQLGEQLSGVPAGARVKLEMGE